MARKNPREPEKTRPDVKRFTSRETPDLLTVVREIGADVRLVGPEPQHLRVQRCWSRTQVVQDVLKRRGKALHSLCERGKLNAYVQFSQFPEPFEQAEELEASPIGQPVDKRFAIDVSWG